jgi:hypothetical protein
MQDSIICNTNPKTLLKISIILLLFSQLLVIISLSGVLWASQGEGSLYWDGDLKGLITGPEDLEGLTYNEAQLAFFHSSDFPSNYAEGQWKTFYRLTMGYYVVTICYITEILFCTVWCLAIWLIRKTVWMVAVVMLLTLIVTVLHTGGFVTWWVLSKAVFSGECKEFEVNEGDQASVCVQVGPVFSMISMCIQLVLLIAWGYLGSKYIKNTRRNTMVYTNMNTLSLNNQ